MTTKQSNLPEGNSDEAIATSVRLVSFRISNVLFNFFFLFFYLFIFVLQVQPVKKGVDF